MSAGEVQNGRLIGERADRTERRAHRLLIDLLDRQGRDEEAAQAAVDFAELHQGHPMAEAVLNRAR